MAEEIHYAFMLDDKKVGLMLVRTEPFEDGYKRSVLTKFEIQGQMINNPFHYLVDGDGLVKSVGRDGTHYNEIPAAHRPEGFPGCAYSEALRGLELKIGVTRSYSCLDEDSGQPTSQLQWVVRERFDYRNQVTGVMTEVFKIEERDSTATKRTFLVDGQGEIHCANWGGTAESIRVESRNQMLEGLSFTEE